MNIQQIKDQLYNQAISSMNSGYVTILVYVSDFSNQRSYINGKSFKNGAFQSEHNS